MPTLRAYGACSSMLAIDKGHGRGTSMEGHAVDRDLAVLGGIPKWARVARPLGDRQVPDREEGGESRCDLVRGPDVDDTRVVLCPHPVVAVRSGAAYALGRLQALAPADEPE